jgi:hypothetical protein
MQQAVIERPSYEHELGGGVETFETPCLETV